ncbi:Ig-like domain-containing protein [Solwaraspora sp. WMMA2065]|uniref:L,D-transpeptidase n=1 Tax=Solwaraspora sp. WMMA2065 TaxID=3015166 RepID=UPI00259B9B72|nr:Ig-like domain-containing protein [Solwaraspora sp. WMMA2065]WJK34707.1 Ig-like domain-containing protein [Solwaraspora sp. WMMA2065]
MRVSRFQVEPRIGRARPPVPRVVTAVALAAALALTGACTGTGDAPTWQGGTESDPSPNAQATITEPAADATDVPASTAITFTTTDATRTTVELTDVDGNPVPGEVDADGSVFLPDGQLEYDAAYTATVTVTGDDGETTVTSHNFRTMAQPGNQVRVSSFLGDGNVVGVAMPLILRFSRDIPQDYRDDVQRRLSVETEPAQEGIWYWVSPTEVQFRPREFWQAGTQLFYKAQTGGLPMGDGWYGRNDLTVDAEVGAALVMTVDNTSKTMVVTKDGETIKEIPVSLGKPKTPSSSGTMIVMEKLKETVFDTYEELGPEEGYRTDIEYAQRLTWGGEFIHAAPWSVADQGVRNVSHGCVNMSVDNAKWLFNQTRVGDPVTVKGTEVQLANGNGWTVWNLSWDELVEGSALPYEPESTELATTESTPGGAAGGSGTSSDPQA